LKNLLKSDKSLKTIAVFEFSKGILVLVAGLGILSLLNNKVQQKFEQIVSQFNYSPQGKITNSIYKAITHPQNSVLIFFALFAICYSLLRFAEGYGLWKQADWAKWIGVISSLIYLPYEIYDLLEHPGILPIIFIIVNIIIIYVLYATIKKKHTSPA
jgi:uncharacterized membrane protein (DUF2068 family)